MQEIMEHGGGMEFASFLNRVREGSQEEMGGEGRDISKHKGHFTIIPVLGVGYPNGTGAAGMFACRSNEQPYNRLRKVRIGLDEGWKVLCWRPLCEATAQRLSKK
ncbi:unnamed protein product [Scytosiphon promiscuus]